MRTQPVLCQSDYEYIEHLLEDVSVAAIANAREIAALRSQLQSARVLEDKCLPPTVARLGSQVWLRDRASNAIESYQLVAPVQADIVAGKLSVIAPLGIQLLGVCSGVSFAFPVPNGLRCLEVQQIVQKRVSTQVATCRP